MKEKKKLAVVLISGGMDSALCAGLAKEQGYDLAGLHLNYGQRTQRRELMSFYDICKFYNIEHKLITDIGYLSQIGGSSLTDDKMPVSKANVGANEVPSSYVPFRNANIMSIAVSWAEVIKAEAIFIGAMQLDSSGYPDCRREFFEAFERTANLGTRPETKIEIKTPIIDFSKRDIVKVGHELGVPFHLTWSCYKDSKTACGECDSCALRLKGFHDAGIEDPLPYRQKMSF